MPISIAIITKNEESRLPDCLRSISFADEVVLVDACSSDNTAKIAKSFGAKVFIEPWKGFSAQKQLAVSLCTNNWVLILDADERVPPKTAAGITKIVNNPSEKVGAYSFRRKNFLHGKWIKSCGWWPNHVVRLVNKSKGAFDGKNIHESWHTKKMIINLGFDIEHLSFRNYSDLIKKMDHYSSLAALDRYNKKHFTNYFSPLGHGLWMFVKTYFLERGCGDGFDGFVISLTNAGGSFFKYAKCRELEKRQGNNQT